jgi:colanic acid biosynthesis glycosyl transferase WcaI
VPDSKLIYFPNAIALGESTPPPQRGEFRDRHGFGREEFLAVYAGNLGVKQGLNVLLEAAPLLRDRRIRIVICGDGAQRESLGQQVREMKLPNVSMLPLQAGRDYRVLLVDADLCFITQQAGSGNSFFPSKLLGLLAEAKPVVTVAAPECELALSLAEGKFGVNVPPGQPRELASMLDTLAKDRQRLVEFGAAGRRYVEQFEKSRVMENFLRELAGVLSII